MAGIYVGTNISRPIPGQFSHHVESRPPKGSEKPGQSSKKGLRTELSNTPQILPPASIFQHAQSLHRLTTVRLGQEKNKLKALFLSGCDDSQSARPAGFFASNDVCCRCC